MMLERSAMTSPIVFALDLPTLAEARKAAAEVAPAVGMIKVGLELFVQTGPEAVKLGKEVDRPVFLDLKLHDIPETVERAVAAASNLGARLVTVHAAGGRTMLKRAVERAEKEGGSLAVCAVTILTSLDDGDLDDIGLSHPGTAERSRASLAAEHLAVLAYEEGVRWFVCSPSEVAVLRAKLGPDATLVTPGIRPSSSSSESSKSSESSESNKNSDQKRTGTPRQAIHDGANWLVVGRPIRDAANRLEAAKAIAASVQ